MENDVVESDEGKVAEIMINYFVNITEKLLKNLDPKKASPQESIPPKILRTNADLFCFLLVALFNRLVEEGSFPNDLKCADVSSLFKEGDTMCKENYRQISLLPAISKLFERLIYTQLSGYMRQSHRS